MVDVIMRRVPVVNASMKCRFLVFSCITLCCIVFVDVFIFDCEWQLGSVGVVFVLREQQMLGYVSTITKSSFYMNWFALSQIPFLIFPFSQTSLKHFTNDNTICPISPIVPLYDANGRLQMLTQNLSKLPKRVIISCVKSTADFRIGLSEYWNVTQKPNGQIDHVWNGLIDLPLTTHMFTKRVHGGGAGCQSDCLQCLICFSWYCVLFSPHNEKLYCAGPPSGISTAHCVRDSIKWKKSKSVMVGHPSFCVDHMFTRG